MMKPLNIAAVLTLMCVAWAIAFRPSATGLEQHDRISIQQMRSDGKKIKSICSLAVSPDGNYVALANQREIVPSHGISLYRIPPIRVRDLAKKEFVAEWTPAMEQQLDPSETHIYHFEFSRDGSKAFVCWRPYNGTELTFEILDCQTWKPIAKFTSPLAEDDVSTFVSRAFRDRHLSDDGSVFTFLSFAGDYSSWRVHVRKTSQPEEDWLVVGCAPQHSAAISPDGKNLLLVAQAGRGDVTVYDIQKREPLRQFESYLIASEAWSHDSVHVALLDMESRQSALVFTASSQDAPKTMPGIAWMFGDHGNILATTGGPVINLFDVRNGTQIGKLEVNSRKSIFSAGSNLPATMFTGGGSMLCYLESQGDNEFSYSVLRFADCRNGQIATESLKLPKRFSSVKLSANEKYIVIDNETEHTVDIWTGLPKISETQD